ncbi:MAG: hypothetical protein SAMD01599839_12790 [Rectinema sp.]
MNFANDPSEFQAMPGLESILQVLHEGVYIVDKERRIQYWNAAAEAITGYSAKTVIGRRCADNILRHVSEDGQQLCTSGCPLQATLEDGKTRDLLVNDGFGHGAGDSVLKMIAGTISHGLRPLDTLATLTARADKHLYASKKSGRNRVIVDA